MQITGKNFIMSFISPVTHQYFEVIPMNFKICFRRSLVLLEMTSEDIFN